MRNVCVSSCCWTFIKIYFNWRIIPGHHAVLLSAVCPDFSHIYTCPSGPEPSLSSPGPIPPACCQRTWEQSAWGQSQHNYLIYRKKRSPDLVKSKICLPWSSASVSDVAHHLRYCICAPPSWQGWGRAMGSCSLPPSASLGLASVGQWDESSRSS